MSGVAGAVALVFALGCGSISQKALELSGGEMDFKTGSDAQMPAGFPLPPPAQGEIVSSGKVGIGGMETVTVQYKVDSTTNLDVYAQVMTDAGMTVQRSDADGTATVSAQRSNGEVWTAALTEDGGGKLLSLVVITGMGQ